MRIIIDQHHPSARTTRRLGLFVDSHWPAMGLSDLGHDAPAGFFSACP